MHASVCIHVCVRVHVSTHVCCVCVCVLLSSSQVFLERLCGLYSAIGEVVQFSLLEHLFAPGPVNRLTNLWTGQFSP